MLTAATTLATALRDIAIIAAVVAVAFFITKLAATMLVDGLTFRRALAFEANPVIYRLSRTLRIDLPQFDARTKAQRADDDAFMALGATFHREN